MQSRTERRLAAEALDRIDRGALPEADAAMAVDGARYTCGAALAAEIGALFRRHPLPLAFGCEVARPGDYVTLDIAGVPVLLMRGDDGTVQGLLNTCRHRGARLLDGAGQVGKAFACPYHNWPTTAAACCVRNRRPSIFPTSRSAKRAWCGSRPRSGTASSGCCWTPPERSTST